MVKGVGLSLLFDVTTWTLEDAFEKFNGMLNPRVLFHQMDYTDYYTFLTDYAVFSNSLALSNTPITSEFAQIVLGTMNPASAVFGWATVGKNRFNTFPSY